MTDRRITWTPADIARLTALWNQKKPQLSSMDIARAMGLSKNALIGKAHRLSLPSRPSPINRTGNKKSMPRAKRPIALPALTSLAVAPVAKVLPIDPASHKKRIIPPLPAVVSAAPVSVVKAPPPAAGVVWTKPNSCQWPFGDPGTKAFRFCGDASVVFGRPYCAEHCRCAYHALREREAA